MPLELLLDCAPIPRDQRLRYGAEDHPSCQGLLGAALASLGVAPDVPDTFDAFMNVPVAPDGTLNIELPLSKAGDAVALRAEVDLLVGVAACPADLSACNGWNPTAIALELVEWSGHNC